MQFESISNRKKIQFMYHKYKLGEGSFHPSLMATKIKFFFYLYHKNHFDWSLGPFFFLKETSYFKLDLIHPFNWLYSEVRNFFITLCNNKHICSIANLLQDSEIYEEVFQYNKNVILRQEILWCTKSCLNKWSSAILF